MRLRHALLAMLATLPVAAQQLTAFGAEGGDFRATLSDGRTLRGADLVGATLSVTQEGVPLTLRIDSAEADARHPDIWLFGLTATLPDGRQVPYCEPDPDGRRLAIPYAEGSGFNLTCSGGAVGKCMRFGYRPWARTPDGSGPLAPYHAACVNMVRGAYGGPERAWTRDGMRIDVYDRAGVQTPDNDPGDAFEAGWTAEGAVCVAHPRVPENGGLAEIVAAAPRLAGRTGRDACTEARAAEWGALVFNRSRPPG